MTVRGIPNDLSESVIVLLILSARDFVKWISRFVMEIESILNLGIEHNGIIC